MIGANIKKIRESKGLGVNELARMAGINSSYLSALERLGKKNPSTKMIDKIAEALEIPKELLFKNENTIDAISSELYKISDFSGVDDMTIDEKKQMVKDILEQDPSIFYELEKDVRNKFIEPGVSQIEETPTAYEVLKSKLPEEAQEELNNFIEYIKHKYNYKGD